MHMNSDTFVGDEGLSVCVLKNLRGMLENPPTLKEKVSHVFWRLYLIPQLQVCRML